MIFLNILQISYVAAVIVFWIILLLFMGGYAWVDLMLLKGLKRLKYGKSVKKQQVSVLICARNEEKNIASCLNSLLNQKELEHPPEIWIANDRSTDKTGEILLEYANKYSNIHIHNVENVPKGISPKKFAITQMHDFLKNELVFITDADCRVPPFWLRDMLKEFENGIDMVLGHSEFEVPKQQPGVFWGVQALEFFSHSVVSAGAIAQKFPITSTANNLAWRKSLFLELDGYKGVDHILSGDDDFLLQKAAIRNSSAIRYCIQPNTFVRTDPQENFKGLWEQRKRWASKTPLYRTQTVLLLQFVFLYYTATLFSVLAFPFSYEIGLGGLLSLIWKSAWDFKVMHKGAKIFQKTGILRWYLPTAILHIPLIVGAVLFGTRGKFKWKV